MQSRTLCMAAMAGWLVQAFPGEVATSVVRPPGLPDGWEAEPLGWVRVTQYTHVETNTRWTASGYRVKDEDEGLVCAISRDWWRKRVKPGDIIWVKGYAEPCAALDSMGLVNSKGFPQRRWIDVYVTDPVRGLDFGIRHSEAYLLRPKHGRLRRPLTPKLARSLRRRH